MCFWLNTETLDFKFLLKPKYNSAPCIVEEGPNRLLTGGTLHGDARSVLFKLHGEEVLECRVLINSYKVSPFDLASSWRAYRESFQPSYVRGIPDVSINPIMEAGEEVQFVYQLPETLFLEQYTGCMTIVDEHFFLKTHFHSENYLFLISGFWANAKPQ